MSQDTQRDALYIDGDWRRPASGRRFPAIDSRTGEEFGSFPEAIEADVDTAVAAARRALHDRTGWAGCTGAERALLMRAFADAIERRAGQLGELIAREVGTPIERATNNNAGAAVGLLRFYADLAAETDQVDIRPAMVGKSLVRREPVGVTAMIVPWNYPLSTMFFKLAPALAMGGTAVVKPSPTTGLDSFLIADAAHEAGIPAGVVNFLPADRQAGEYLVTHSGIDKVAFTGSTEAGRRIGALCGGLLRPVTLELGGKSAAVLLEDVDLDLFLEHMGELCFANNGQTCTNNTRILVPRARYGEIVDAVTETAAGWAVGDPLDRATEIGPVAGAAQFERVLSYLTIGQEEGARVTTGGGRAAESGSGYFVSPTVFADCEQNMRVTREEIFGPAVSLVEYDGKPETAIELANDSEYGLSGSVWTSDDELALRIADAVDTGTISVNHANFDIGAPFGGRKASGVGSELGREAIHSYLHLKTIFLPEAMAASTISAPR